MVQVVFQVRGYCVTVVQGVEREVTKRKEIPGAKAGQKDINRIVSALHNLINTTA